MDSDEKRVGTVFWCDYLNGFGFVQFDDEGPDALLGAGKAAGARIIHGARVACTTTPTSRGDVVATVDLIFRPEWTHEKADGEEVGELVTIDGKKGFGFVRLPDGRDVFVHAETWRRSDVLRLWHKQKIRVRWVATQKGMRAVDWAHA